MCSGVQLFALEFDRSLLFFYEESSRNNRRRGTISSFSMNFQAFSGPCYPHFGSFLRVWSGIGRKLEQGGGRRCVLVGFWR